MDLSFFLLLLLPVWTTGQNVTIGCFVEGECKGGGLVGIFTNLANSLECNRLCREESTCRYFTHEKQGLLCTLYDSCLEVSTERCDDCLSGDSDCFCDVQGRCIGNVIHAEINPRCPELCYKDTECEFWTFDSSDRTCVLLESCPEVDEDCDTCLSGENLCYRGIKPPSDFLFIVGGENTNQKLSTVEVLDLSGQNRQCQPVVNYPMAVAHAAVALDHSKPVVCGGVQVEETSECWMYDDVEWIPFPSMFQQRQRLRSLQIDDGSFTLTGGLNSPNILMSSIDYSNGDDSFFPGISLPMAVHQHCIAKVDDNRAILAGGLSLDNQFEERVFILDIEAESWTQLPSLGHGRRLHVCGVVGDYFYVVGGSDDTSALTSVEKIDINSMFSWETGPNLPGPVAAPSAVIYQDSLLVVSGDNNHKGIYSLSPGMDTWLTLGTSLSMGRKFHVSALVSTDELNCE